MSEVFLIGDACWDVYHQCAFKGESAEVEGAPIETWEGATRLPGMGANVFVNLQALGVDVAAQLPAHWPLKHRIMNRYDRQLMRIDMEDWCEEISPVRIPSDTQVIVVSGYGKGAVTLGVIEQLIAFGVPIFVDTKSDPYPWLPYFEDVMLFPNQKEYLAHRENYDWFPYVVVKRGAEGIELRHFGDVVRTLPSFSDSPICVNGAGDTFLAGMVVAALEGHMQRNFDFALAAAANVVEQPPLERTTTRRAVEQRLIREHSANPAVGFGGVDTLVPEALWE